MDLTTLDRLPLWIGGRATPARTTRYGEVTNPALASITDLNWRELVIFSPLILGTLLLGVQPGLVMDLTAASVDRLVAAYNAVGGR